MKFQLKRKPSLYLVLLVCFFFLVSILYFFFRGNKVANRTIITNFNRITKVPDPANIFTTSDWYFLNHISSPLVAFNHQEGRFNPLLAEKWEIDGSRVVFTLRQDAKFSDGAPIKPEDVANSIKRLVIKKTSTHFPIWEQLVGSESLRKLSDKCFGIELLDTNRIKFSLKENVESFFLLMASPEGGIWASENIDKDSLNLKPTKYSGPYAFQQTEQEPFLLLKNLYSPIHKMFLESPEKIEFYSASGQQLENLMENKKLDLYMEPVRPYFSSQYKDWGYLRSVSINSTILYLSKIGDHTKHIGKQFFKRLWELDPTEDLTPADNILPFGSLNAISKETLYEMLPENSSTQEIRIAILSPYFRPELAELIRRLGRQSDANISVTEVDFEKWANLNGKQTNDPGFDFVFSIYVASERYPAVQMRFLLDGRVPPFDFATIDQTEYSAQRMETISKLEKWFISTQNILPLFFTRTHILYKQNIDIGIQPTADAEIQLWRVKKLDFYSE